MTDEQIGGQISLEVSMKPGEARTGYPCTMCTVFNTAKCDSCKCNFCTVEEQMCPKCKNRPQTISQYQVLYGKPQPGENWEAADLFNCTRCGGVIKKKWELLPCYEKCQKCNNVFYLRHSFAGTKKACLHGAHRPGMNWQKEDTFKCPNCNSFFNASKVHLPGHANCSGCKRQYYCYPSPEEKRGILF